MKRKEQICFFFLPVRFKFSSFLRPFDSLSFATVWFVKKERNSLVFYFSLCFVVQFCQTVATNLVSCFAHQFSLKLNQTKTTQLANNWLAVLFVKTSCFLFTCFLLSNFCLFYLNNEKHKSLAASSIIFRARVFGKPTNCKFSNCTKTI